MGQELERGRERKKKRAREIGFGTMMRSRIRIERKRTDKLYNQVLRWLFEFKVDTNPSHLELAIPVKLRTGSLALNKHKHKKALPKSRYYKNGQVLGDSIPRTINFRDGMRLTNHVYAAPPAMRKKSNN
ncbi:hypothetical protein EVAR_50028_1 [Eumeta japonica]|uniref:Uncharacterized protein n=1 Tax=Eumeta variegata TaxID=151549 RepID=A0A4C1YNR3_EUMVA|nr:hypothetical protein EVAR_50028_1 [Eumeta japonica]